MRARRAAGVLALAALATAGAGPVRGDDPPPSPVDLLNAVLAGLLGFTEVSPEKLQEEVAEVGGVPFQQPVPLDYITPEKLAPYLREVLDEEYPPERAAADERMLVAFDLLPEGTSLRALRARVLEDNVAGFYDERPGKKRLFAVSVERRLTPANQIILAHELRHALQDQYADLHAAVPDAVGDFDDRRIAFMSLLEGDATLVMERFMARRLGREPAAGATGGLGWPAVILPDTPPVLRDQLLAPYLAGRDFAEAVFRAGGWPALRRAWDAPPSSTEQVLHPEKFLAGERPRAVELRYAPRGARVLSEGVLGETLTRTLLGDGSERAAAGWGGDAFRAFDVEGRTLLVWKSEWDDAAEAEEFHAALGARLDRTHGARRSEGGALVFARGRWEAGIRISRGTVTLVRADDRVAFRAALAASP